MSFENSLAPLFLGMGGNVLSTVGTAFTSVGVLFAIKKISGFGIDMIARLPYYFGNKEDAKTFKQEQQQKPWSEIIKREGEKWSYLSLLIMIGIFFKKGGAWMSLPSTAQIVTNFMQSE